MMESQAEAHNTNQQRSKMKTEEKGKEEGRKAESSPKPMYTTVGSLVNDNFAMHIHPPVRRGRSQARVNAPSARAGDHLGPPRPPQFMPQHEPAGNLNPYYTMPAIQPSYDNGQQFHPSHGHPYPRSAAPTFTHGNLPPPACGPLQPLAFFPPRSAPFPGYAPIQQNIERAVSPPGEKKTHQDDPFFFAHVNQPAANAQATSAAASLAAGTSKVPKIGTTSNVGGSTSSTLKDGITGQPWFQSYPKSHPQPFVAPFPPGQHCLEATNCVVPTKAGEVFPPAQACVLPPPSFAFPNSYVQPPAPGFANPNVSFNLPTITTGNETKNSDGNIKDPGRKSGPSNVLPPSQSILAKDAVLNGASAVREGQEKCSSSGKNTANFIDSPIGHLPFADEIELRRQAEIARLLASSIVLGEEAPPSDTKETTSNMNNDLSRSTHHNPGLGSAPNWRQHPVATPAAPGPVFPPSITRPQSTIGSAVSTLPGHVNEPFALGRCSSTVGVQPQLARNAISVPPNAFIPPPYIPVPTSILATGPGAPQPLSAGPPGIRRMDPLVLQERAAPAVGPAQQTINMANHGAYQYGAYPPNQACRGQALVPICTNPGAQHGFHGPAPPPKDANMGGGTATPVTMGSWTPASSINSAEKESKAASGQNPSDGYGQVSAFLKPPYRLANQGNIADTQPADQVVKYYPKGLPSNFSQPERVDPVPSDWTKYYPRNPGEFGCMRQEAAKDGFQYHAPNPETPKPKTCKYGAIGQERYGSGVPGTDQYWRNKEQLDMTNATSKAGWNGKAPDQVEQHKVEGPPGWAHLHERRNQALAKEPLDGKSSENDVSSPNMTPITGSPAHNGDSKAVGHKQ